MGEKIPYKARKPGGGRKKRKPEYDAGKKLKEQLDAAVVLYNSEMSLQTIADALSLNPIKVRKLLITAGVYESDTAKLVRQTFNTFRETQDYSTAVTSTMSALQLSRPSVTSYLPYEKGVYFSEDADAANISTGAERQRHYRAVVALKKNPCEENLWKCVVAFRGYLPGKRYQRQLSDVGAAKHSGGKAAGKGSETQCLYLQPYAECSQNQR